MKKHLLGAIYEKVSSSIRPCCCNTYSCTLVGCDCNKAGQVEREHQWLQSRLRLLDNYLKKVFVHSIQQNLWEKDFKEVINMTNFSKQLL